jgi:hypothetical protein
MGLSAFNRQRERKAAQEALELSMPKIEPKADTEKPKRTRGQGKKTAPTDAVIDANIQKAGMAGISEDQNDPIGAAVADALKGSDLPKDSKLDESNTTGTLDIPIATGGIIKAVAGEGTVLGKVVE